MVGVDFTASGCAVARGHMDMVLQQDVFDWEPCSGAPLPSCVVLCNLLEMYPRPVQYCALVRLARHVAEGCYLILTECPTP